jgi:hypothetical protein
MSLLIVDMLCVFDILEVLSVGLVDAPMTHFIFYAPLVSEMK